MEILRSAVYQPSAMECGGGAGQGGQTVAFIHGFESLQSISHCLAVGE